jgi:hypothetical protein
MRHTRKDLEPRIGLNCCAVEFLLGAFSLCDDRLMSFIANDKRFGEDSFVAFAELFVARVDFFTL